MHVLLKSCEAVAQQRSNCMRWDRFQSDSRISLALRCLRGPCNWPGRARCGPARWGWVRTWWCDGLRWMSWKYQRCRKRSEGENVSISQWQRDEETIKDSVASVPSHFETFLHIYKSTTAMTTAAALSSPTSDVLKFQVPDSQAHSVGNVEAKTMNYWTQTPSTPPVITFFMTTLIIHFPGVFGFIFIWNL